MTTARYFGRRPGAPAIVVVVLGLSLGWGCGMRGPPLPPQVFVPRSVTPLEVQRFDDHVFIRFDVPPENTDRSSPADLDRVEVYALTTASEAANRQLSFEEWQDYATLVAVVPVEAPGEDTDTALEPPSETRVARQGEEVILVEELTAATRVPVVFEETESVDVDPDEDDPNDDSENEEEGEEARPPVVPLASPPLPEPPRRTYVAFAISTRERESAPSPRIDVSLADPVPPPEAPTVVYNESIVVLEWETPAAARLPIQEPAEAPVLASTPVIDPPTPTRYLVFATSAEGDPDTESAVEASMPAPDYPEFPEPINPIPLTQTSYREGGIVFGVERCYTVRTLDGPESLTVRGAASPETCVVPVDTFAPQAPAGLGAVASPGAINLVWDPNPEPDIIGYLVLRGVAPGATLQPLTPEPIPDTTFRDDGVDPDVRYVYAIQAVDNAMPPNISEPSPMVTEQAR